MRDVLGSDHLCFFVRRVVERLELSRFHASDGVEGGQLYHPTLMLKVWLYACTPGIASPWRLEQRIREDMAFRYLARGSQPDYWALNAFRRRHRLAINDRLTQVVELEQVAAEAKGTGRFLREGRNVVLPGPSGVGTTHLACTVVSTLMHINVTGRIAGIVIPTSIVACSICSASAAPSRLRQRVMLVVQKIGQTSIVSGDAIGHPRLSYS